MNVRRPSRALLCLPLSTVVGCASFFAELAQSARDSAAQSLSCPTVELTRLRAWAFRADGCGQSVYWTCAAAHHFDVCCQPVASEREAMAVVRVTSHTIEAPAEDVFDPEKRLLFSRKYYAYCYDYDHWWHFARN